VGDRTDRTRSSLTRRRRLASGSATEPLAHEPDHDVCHELERASRELQERSESLASAVDPILIIKAAYMVPRSESDSESPSESPTHWQHGACRCHSVSDRPVARRQRLGLPRASSTKGNLPVPVPVGRGRARPHSCDIPPGPGSPSREHDSEAAHWQSSGSPPRPRRCQSRGRRPALSASSESSVGAGTRGSTEPPRPRRPKEQASLSGRQAAPRGGGVTIATPSSRVVEA
jgi:hypothetical protein